MKAARLTAPSAHHRLESRPSLLAVTVFADTGSFLSPIVIYGVPVSCSYTLYRYVVKHACTMYSCQVVKTRTGSDGPDGDKPRLSKRTVTENALKLADADGLDTLTIRKLAEHLGVTPMALYWHFRSKEDLLEGVAEQVWGELDVNVDPDAPWWAQLRGLMASLVSVLRAH